MIKQLSPLEALKSLLGPLEINWYCKEFREHYKIIETTLKEKEKQDKILDFLKEHIVFEGDVVKANFQWIIDDKETEEAVKEWLK